MATTGLDLPPDDGTMSRPVEPPPRRPTPWFRDPGVRTVLITTVVALALHLAWRFLLANDGGDLAAQDFWAAAAKHYPGSAYNFTWYGGMHLPSYSIGSPYLMAVVGVRTTLIVAGTLVATLTSLVIVRSGVVRHPLIPSLFAAVGMAGNAVSGRATFALGMMFALGAVATVFSWPLRWRELDVRHTTPRVLLGALCATLATFGSPVAGFFLGLLAAALWLTADELPAGTPLRVRLRTAVHNLLAHRRLASYSLGVPPVVVILLSALLFPFSGEQPMHWPSVILPALMGMFVFLVVPLSWRTARALGPIYTVAVFAAWLVPSEIGTNVVRLGLIFGSVALGAAWCSGESRNPFGRLPGLFRRLPARLFVALAIATCLTWQISAASLDAVHSRPDQAWTQDVDPLVAQLEARHANLGRVEVVPSRSHVEASTMAPYFTLARGWNRQADLKRNPLFYDDKTPLTPAKYRAWLDRWAVSYVVVPPGAIDPSSQREADLVLGGLPYLQLVWSDSNWRLYAVHNPTPLVAPPGQLTEIDEAHMTIHVDKPGAIRIRMLYSPWLGLVRADGSLVAAPKQRANGTYVNRHGCVAPVTVPVRDSVTAPGAKPQTDVWTVLRVTRPGDYTLAAPYSPNPGTPCPTPKTDEGGATS